MKICIILEYSIQKIKENTNTSTSNNYSVHIFSLAFILFGLKISTGKGFKLNRDVGYCNQSTVRSLAIQCRDNSCYLEEIIQNLIES